MGEVGPLAELQGADVHHGVGEARLRDQADELPGHLQIYNKGLHSYRELPLRYGEFGACHRNEPSGALHGIMRIRGFTQDDGHIFCTEEQIQPEVTAFSALLKRVYTDFGFTEMSCKLPRPAKRVGADELWDKAERALRSASRTPVFRSRSCLERARSTAPRSNTT